jgi:hypothetical protein
MEGLNIRPIVDITLDSVQFIDQVINGDIFENDSVEEKKYHVKRNVDHLSIMLNNEDFNTKATDEQKKTISDSIAKGNTYISTL